MQSLAAQLIMKERITTTEAKGEGTPSVYGEIGDQSTPRRISLQSRDSSKHSAIRTMLLEN